MAFRLNAAPDARTVRAVAAGQIESALASLADPVLSAPAKAFAVRKRCKKLRALVRLARPALVGHAAEDTAFRAVARPLAPLRDGEALIGTYDRLFRQNGAPRAATAAVRRQLVARRTATLALVDACAILADTRQALEQAHARVGAWRIEGDSVSHGFARTRRRAARALRVAVAEPDVERLHAWRRHAKYHWHQCRLLRALAPEMVERTAVADRVAKLLGEHHDLALLAQAVGSATVGRRVAALARDRQHSIEREVFALGAELFSSP